MIVKNEMFFLGTENSNHGAQFKYQNHTTRDGGFVDRHVSGDFCDLFDSYMKAVKLVFKNKVICFSTPPTPQPEFILIFFRIIN